MEGRKKKGSLNTPGYLKNIYFVYFFLMGNFFSEFRVTRTAKEQGNLVDIPPGQGPLAENGGSQLPPRLSSHLLLNVIYRLSGYL